MAIESVQICSWLPEGMIYSYAECTCLLKKMADPNIADYELRNNSTVFEELEVSIVDFPLASVLKIYKFSQYLDTISPTN